MDHIFSGRCASGTTVVAIECYGERDPLHLRIIVRYVTHRTLTNQQTITITLPESLMDVAPVISGSGVMSYVPGTLSINTTLAAGTEPFDTVTLDLTSTRAYTGTLEPLSFGMSALHEPETVLFTSPISVLPFDVSLTVSHVEAANGSHIIRNRLTHTGVPNAVLGAMFMFSTPLRPDQFVDLEMTGSQSMHLVAETADHHIAWGWTALDLREHHDLTLDVVYPGQISDDDLALWARPPGLTVGQA